MFLYNKNLEEIMKRILSILLLTFTSLAMEKSCINKDYLKILITELKETKADLEEVKEADASLVLHGFNTISDDEFLYRLTRRNRLISRIDELTKTIEDASIIE